jgi:hypothetical protein
MLVLRRWARSALPLFVLCSLAACPDRTVANLPVDPIGEQGARFTLAVNRNLDLLFVVDDSNSMEREQDELAEHFRSMIEVFDHLPDGRPNLHIGVISTDVGAPGACVEPRVPAGQLRNAPNPSDRDDLDGCQAPVDRYLIDVFDEAAGARRINYEQSLGEAFTCIATLGIGGCRFEAPLEALRRALDPSNLANAGFLRDDSLLAVVFLTDEDDCSVADPRLFGVAERVGAHQLGPLTGFRCFSQGVTCDGGRPAAEPGPRTACEPRDDLPFLRNIDDYVAALSAVRPDPRRLVVAGIMGKASVAIGRDDMGRAEVLPSCALPGSDPGDPDDTETAYPPVRTDAFLAAFAQSVRTEICSDDLRPAIQEIAEFIAGRVYPRCLEGNLHDRDPATPGVQPECKVTETVDPDGVDRVATVLPLCGLSGEPTRPCWTAEPSPEVCASQPTQLEVVVHYPAGVTRPPDTLIEARCLSALGD